ncbi:hypothetical protein PBRA_003395 [Plasmodiophora brassicae]|uniref:Uncharacterized protein n=1 Tax=Plasmodiophora brassicae TaxID=37360 RepID=A0A0G4J848_PLABS|nr:hypothetical protein PBRA_003395 [Plasmodiophora brassicae]
MQAMSAWSPSVTPRRLADGDEVDDILRCFICFDRVVDAHLCPSCSSMCCKTCIVRWLTERRPQCPHCQAELYAENLVNCRFVQDLAKAMDRMQTRAPVLPREMCPEHDVELQYVCSDCQQCICADCSMLSSKHAGHTFEKLAVVHDRQAQRLKQEVAAVEERIAQLKEQDAVISANINAIVLGKNEAVTALRAAMNQMHENILSQMRSKMLILEAQRNDLAREISVLESIVHELSCHIDPNLCARSELIRRSIDLQSMANSARVRARTKVQSVSDRFQSEIAPEFHGAVFCLSSFLEAHANEELIYSQPFSRNGLTWRLKVYPNGNGTARGVFLSVFLEMSSEFSGAEQYEYQVQMVNHRDPEKTITRRFCSKFESGESWGYNRFFRIDALIRDGYISESGALVLRFSVRPPSLLLANAELQRYADSLEASQLRSQRALRRLKLRLLLRNAKKKPSRRARVAVPASDTDAESGDRDADAENARRSDSECKASYTESDGETTAPFEEREPGERRSDPPCGQEAILRCDDYNNEDSSNDGEEDRRSNVPCSNEDAGSSHDDVPTQT